MEINDIPDGTVVDVSVVQGGVDLRVVKPGRSALAVGTTITLQYPGDRPDAQAAVRLAIAEVLSGEIGDALADLCHWAKGAVLHPVHDYASAALSSRVPPIAGDSAHALCLCAIAEKDLLDAVIDSCVIARTARLFRAAALQQP